MLWFAPFSCSAEPNTPATGFGPLISVPASPLPLESAARSPVGASNFQWPTSPLQSGCWGAASAAGSWTFEPTAEAIMSPAASMAVEIMCFLPNFRVFPRLSIPKPLHVNGLQRQFSAILRHKAWSLTEAAFGR
jgi:hypothetical protein